MTGVHRNSWTAPKSQIPRFVSKKIPPLSHCIIPFCNLPILYFFIFQLASPERICFSWTLIVNWYILCQFDQIGVGLMVFQQFGGINGVCFYVSNIFESAGKEVLINTTIKGDTWPLPFPPNRELNIKFYIHPAFKSAGQYLMRI